MGGADAICFAGGIGENAPAIRAMICEGLEFAGIRVDEALNRTVAGGEGRVSPEGARPEVWVIPTDEELLIARDTFRVTHGMETRY
jgi:acetate kinase